MLADVIRIPEKTADLYIMDLVSDLERARSNLEIASRKLQAYPLPPEKRQEIQTHLDRMISWAERTADNLQGAII
jgi:CHASE3 domain sensor protein